MKTLLFVLVAAPAIANSPASWSPNQATGAPNVEAAGDNANAWATQQENAGVEWIELHFPRRVRVATVRVFENLSPGAVVRISGRSGSEWIDIWAPPEKPVETRGVCPVAPSGASYTNTSGGVCVLEVEAVRAQETDTLRIWLDTRRVAGWNEIDAVELVGTSDGRAVRQWATSAMASSSYASGEQPFAGLVGKRVRIRLLNRDDVRATLESVAAGFLTVREGTRSKWIPISSVGWVEPD